MLSGYFENCYGIKQLNLPRISFRPCNKAIIYAPNGAMKTSFSKVFEDISKGDPTSDRIFRNAATRYSVTYYASQFEFPPQAGNDNPHSENIYVINSFADKFEFTKETVSTLLADEGTRNQYNVLIGQFSETIAEIENALREITGLTKPKIKGQLIVDLGLDATADWPDIIEKIGQLETGQLAFLDEISYSTLFNTKAEQVYRNPTFRSHVSAYIENLEVLLQSSSLLSEKFSDHSAEALSKYLASYNLFEAQHKIVLRDGTSIDNVEEWRTLVQNELRTLYEAPELATIFKNLKKLFSKNAESIAVRDVIVAHRDIIPYLLDIDTLKLYVWKNCFSRLQRPFEEYEERVVRFKEAVHELYEQASAQSARWAEVVTEFNRRFRVPFKVKITNKPNFLLKDEAPNIEFEYSRGAVGNRESVDLKTDEMKSYLSMGERRALYLLYILFDLERIRKSANEGGGQYLILADDISDSFDYKNKYAIIEYLNDLASTNGIDLLMLTHNFDFFRTVKSRLGICRSNCYVAQRAEDGVVTMAEFRYQKDFFKNVIRANIRNGEIDTLEKKKCLIASIPFYRNLTEYSGNDVDYIKMTCFLHLKTTPLDTSGVNISDLFNLITPYLDNQTLQSPDEPFMSLLNSVANSALADTDEISLENKLVLSIAARLEIEKHLKTVIIANEGHCDDAESNQTRKWFAQARPYLTATAIEIIEEVNLVTPESIHLNAFMYEPLIDVSVWTLKDLYRRARALSQQGEP